MLFNSDTNSSSSFAHKSDLDELLVVGLGEAVVERRAAKTITVGHLDDGDTGAVKCGDDVADVGNRELVALVVRTVTQR